MKKLLFASLLCTLTLGLLSSCSKDPIQEELLSMQTKPDGYVDPSAPKPHKLPVPSKQ